MKHSIMDLDAMDVKKAVELVTEVLHKNKIDRIVGLTALSVIQRVEFERDGTLIGVMKPEEAEKLREELQVQDPEHTEILH